MKLFAKLYLGLQGRLLCILAICLFASANSRAQRLASSTLDSAQQDDLFSNDLSFSGISGKPLSLRFGDTVLLINKNVCKGNYSTRHVFDNTRPVMAATEPRLYAVTPPPVKHTPFLRIHGNVNYDFLYRSYIDTPFSQHDFQQHTIQTSLSVTVKDKYPLRVNLSNRC